MILSSRVVARHGQRHYSGLCLARSRSLPSVTSSTSASGTTMAPQHSTSSLSPSFSFSSSSSSAAAAAAASPSPSPPLSYFLPPELEASSSSSISTSEEKRGLTAENLRKRMEILANTSLSQRYKLQGKRFPTEKRKDFVPIAVNAQYFRGMYMKARERHVATGRLRHQMKMLSKNADALRAQPEKGFTFVDLYALLYSRSDEFKVHDVRHVSEIPHDYTISIKTESVMTMRFIALTIFRICKSKNIVAEGEKMNVIPLEPLDEDEVIEDDWIKIDLGSICVSVLFDPVMEDDAFSVLKEHQPVTGLTSTGHEVLEADYPEIDVCATEYNLVVRISDAQNKAWERSLDGYNPAMPPFRGPRGKYGPWKHKRVASKHLGKPALWVRPKVGSNTWQMTSGEGSSSISPEERAKRLSEQRKQSASNRKLYMAGMNKTNRERGDMIRELKKMWAEDDEGTKAARKPNRRV